MAEQMSFLTGTYTQAQLANHLSHMASNGYIFNHLDEYEVVSSTPEAMTVSVKAGGAYIEGYFYENDTATTKNISAADAVLNRIDRIVLRLTPLSAPYMQIAVLEGVAAATPSAPALTQNSTTYELSLAQIYVGAAVAAIYTSNITDERNTIYCGAASSLQSASGALLYNDTLPILYGEDTVLPVASNGICIGDGDHTAWIVCADSTYNKVYEIDTDVNPIVFTAKTNITTARNTAANYACNGIYYDGKVYVIGGYNAAVSNKNEAFDPSANTWATLTAITTPRCNFGIAEIDGIIYCIGGQTTGGAYSAKNEAYDPSGDSWAGMTDLPTTPSAGGTLAVALNGYVWILYKDAGAVKFYRFDPGADAYSAKTAPADATRLSTLASNGALVTTYRLWAFDGYIWLSSYGGYLFRYSIADDEWVCVSETFFSFEYVSGGVTYVYYALYYHTAALPALMLLQCGDRRFFYPAVTGMIDPRDSLWYTYYMYLDTVSADKILAFRQRASEEIQLCNISTQTAGEAIYTMSTDKWGIYYDYYRDSQPQVIQIYG